MLIIEKYNKSRDAEVEKLRVKPEQAQFTVDRLGEFILSLKEDEHPHVIMENDQVVGFFVLDLSYSDTYSFSDPKALGVRALLIDQNHQGLGIASKTLNLLPSYVASNYPDFERLQLTVNCRNKAAYNCYLKCGFEDTGSLYLGGPVGPQHIMQRTAG
ncbi:GNAT family N-acetyltransferase [Halomonas sp. 18071143]|uniref:GNAT family N-acetyltransferase n=1 Tax=Halomonas sp. 18071143 TaxID=2855441 RepID=UPI001C47AF9B|nr:GNAT family N-acetyltransferase [Halomonas sp. 18071143]